MKIIFETRVFRNNKKPSVRLGFFRIFRVQANAPAGTADSGHQPEKRLTAAFAIRSSFHKKQINTRR